VAPRSVGLTPAETRETRGAELDALAAVVEADGGAVVGRYLDPFGAKAILVVALPIDRVEPTPYQRDPSDAHVKRLMAVIEKIGRFVDPIVVVRAPDGYWTPNGNHRLQAMKKLGARTIMGLLLPEPEVAFKILALNTEKAHNLREKSLEAIRMARALAKDSDRPESDFELELEQAPFLTLGVCYERRPRFSGGAYQSVLRRIDGFLNEPLRDAVKERERRAKELLRVDDAVARIVEKLKERGFKSAYLKPFVVARVNPIRFSTSTEFDYDEVLERMREKAAKFDTEKVRQEDVARMGGGGEGEE
jgi:ParB family chromosome partitioning protein